MAWFSLRPTFDIALSEPRLDAIAKLEQAYAKLTSPKSFLLHGEYGELHLAAQEHRLWSPHLSFYVSEKDGLGLIRGRFAPRLEVWTFVWVVYLSMAFSAFFGLALAYSQWMLGESIWGLWVALVALAIIMLLTVTANVGQQWSSDQMATLRKRLEDVLVTAGLAIAPQP